MQIPCLEDRVAQTALDHYDRVISNRGKPKDREWTVYAAIVAVETSSPCWVVSAATGTQCTAKRFCTLHDSHAEVLCRRGLVRFLWNELRETVANEKSMREHRLLHANRNKESNDPESKQSTSKFWSLRSDLKLCLYVSDSPCGDASIYELTASCQANNAQYTGAKLARNNGVVIREQMQANGVLRTKSGRSNLLASLRSDSMSCSDKIARWSILGLEGSLLSRFIDPPLRLSLIVVGKDPQAASSAAQMGALYRSNIERVQQYLDMLQASSTKDKEKLKSFIAPPGVALSVCTFSRGKSQSGSHSRQHQTEKRPKAIGLSINWILGEGEEVCVGARGIRHGKRPRQNEDYAMLQSRLCRSSLWSLARRVVALSEKGTKSNAEAALSPSITYSQAKASWSSANKVAMREQLFAEGPLSGWIVGPSRDH